MRVARRTRALAALARAGGCALVLAATGCALDEPGAGSDCPDVRVELRDPETLRCKPVPVPSAACPDVREPPTWPACLDRCAVHDEAACLETSGCRATYEDLLLADGAATDGDPFLGCFSIDRAGPARGGCEGLDAQGCSMREQCAGWYQRGPTCPSGPPPGPDGVTFGPNGELCTSFFVLCGAEPVLGVPGSVAGVAPGGHTTNHVR